MLLYLSVLSTLFLSVFAGHSNIKRHNALAQRKRDDVSLVKRGQSFSGARATYYAAGLGACGITNSGSDFIVALNFKMFGNNEYLGPNCFKKITISYGGKTTVAQITDACEACPSYGGIDMSESLFKFFSPLSAGVISVDWHFNDGGDEPPSKPTTSKWVAPTPKWTPPAEHTTTHHTTTTTTTKTSHSSTPTKSSTSQHSSSSAAPSPSSPAGANNIANLYQAVLGLGNCAVAGVSN